MRVERKNKIIVAVAADKQTRDKLLQSLLVAAGFAKITSDAKKIISVSINDIDIDSALFIAAYDINFAKSDMLTQRLIRLALMGVPVLVSAKKIPNQVLPFCDIHYFEI